MNTRNISWGAKGGQCVGLTTLPPSCANCFEIWEPYTQAHNRDMGAHIRLTSNLMSRNQVVLAATATATAVLNMHLQAAAEA